MMDITLPCIPPRVGFRYKTRIGLTTLPMRMNKGHHQSKYKFTAQLSDGDYASWKENGHFKPDDEVWKWDLIQELPIELSDFTAEDETPYGKGVTLRFLDATIYVTMSRFSPKLGRMVSLVSIYGSTIHNCDREYDTIQEALNVVRSHYKRDTLSTKDHLSVLESKTRVMMDELLIMRKKIHDMMDCSDHIR